MEFEEVRPYQPGDEVRTIDWNVTARTGEVYVKRYVEERELTVMLVVDASASENFGSVQQFKRELAAELTAVLSFRRHHQQRPRRPADLHRPDRAVHPAAQRAASTCCG